MSEREVWTYYISRNSENGVLDAEYDVWWKQPIRKNYGCCVVWEAVDQNETGHFRKHTKLELELERVTLPDTDLELIVCQRWASNTTPASKPTKRPMRHFK